jgi:phosphoribosylformimino-5-aminoimidazole carboxamide ribotide isomerase
MTIREVPLETVWRLRQEVLYPDRDMERQKLPEDQEGMHWGVYLGKDPVSVISVFQANGVCRFRKFATRREHQGKGYGSLLLRHVMDRAEAGGARSIWCNARTTASALYKRFGMEPVGSAWKDSGYMYVKMEKQFRGMEIIPAIDIIDGKCVRLTQGDYAQKRVYNEDPLEVAKMFEAAGLKRLHLVDLDGAKDGAVRNWKVLERITGGTNLVIDFGGGIKKVQDLEIVFGSGAALATIGSMAVRHPEVMEDWMARYGADKFLLGADVKGEKVAVGGWLETTDTDVFDFIKNYKARGIQQVFCTDVSKDGLLQGPSVDLYAKIIERFPDLWFIASGGVASVADLRTLQEIGCRGAIIGKAIYEGYITLKELSDIWH